MALSKPDRTVFYPPSSGNEAAIPLLQDHGSASNDHSVADCEPVECMLFCEPEGEQHEAPAPPLSPRKRPVEVAETVDSDESPSKKQKEIVCDRRYVRSMASSTSTRTAERWEARVAVRAAQASPPTKALIAEKMKIESAALNKTEKMTMQNTGLTKAEKMAKYSEKYQSQAAASLFEPPPPTKLRKKDMGARPQVKAMRKFAEEQQVKRGTDEMHLWNAFERGQIIAANASGNSNLAEALQSVHPEDAVRCGRGGDDGFGGFKQSAPGRWAW